MNRPRCKGEIEKMHNRPAHIYRSAKGVGLAMALVALMLTATTAAAASWTADPNHTQINFSVKHFFTPVSGTFEDFKVDLNYDPDNPEKSSIEVTIHVASINTGNEKRDNHLRSGDWFEAEKYPVMTFKSTSVRKTGDNQLVAHGNLTIKGDSREIDLPITLLGSKQIPDEMQAMLGGSKEVASFQATTSVDRGDFGVGVGNWAATLVVGSEVKIEILLEAYLR